MLVHEYKYNLCREEDLKICSNPETQCILKHIFRAFEEQYQDYQVKFFS